MSSLPGLHLEDFLKWNYDLVVVEEDSREANVSLGMAEALGTIRPRPRIAKEHFAGLVAIVEPLREVIEQRLDDFDEDNQSWRGYAGCAFDDFYDEYGDKGLDYLKALGYVK